MTKRRRTGGNGAALQAAISLAFVVPAAGQPAPNARPQGGQVVAGSAAIATGTATTTINQSSNRAAIDWRSFDVGRDQSVVFQQPNSGSITLNRVTGPDPSAIAGRISANGQLVLTNPSGVMFYAGSQVNAQSVIVSAPGITNQNFMAGRMVFDQLAHPNARIENAGAITVKEAGLAALVAPSVANSGTITARLGHVVLAGAAAHTLDMYGDGLVSIDITQQVTQAPIGPGGKSVTALVTNTGTIAADGGTIQLTARAADGVVNTLVQARGRIQANTAGDRVGQIEITGTGGSVVIEGRVAADGRAPGTTGGSVVVAGSESTVVAPTAQVTANGRAGGGTVAVGTTLARARGTGPAPAGTSAKTVVAAGARISADATASGNGGRVTVLSTQSTTMAGAVTARGGPTAGNGGTIELSGETGFKLTGTADTSAPHGMLGTVVLDPRDLTITDTANGTTNLTPTNGVDPNIAANAGGTTTDAYVTPAQIEALTGNIRLQATRDLVVASSITYGGGSGVGTGGNLTLEAGRNLTVNSGVTIIVPGFQGTSSLVPGIVTLTAGASTIAGYDPAGKLTILGAVQTTALNLSAGTGGIALSGALTANYSVSDRNPGTHTTAISTTGAVVQTAGSLITSTLSGSATSFALVATGNQISAIGGTSSLTATAGGVTITTSTPLTVTAGAPSPGIAVPTGQTVSLLTDTLTLTAGGAGVAALSAPGGTVALAPYTNGRDIVLTSSTTKPSGALALTTTETGLINAATLQLGGNTSNVTFGQVSETTPVDLVAHGNFGQLQLLSGGAVTQTTALVVNSLSNAGSPVELSSVTLQNTGNSIPAIGTLVVSGTLAFSTSGTLSVSGTVTANATLTLASSGNMRVLGSAYMSGPNGTNLIVDNGGTGSLDIAGTVTSNRGTQLTAGTGGVSLSGSIVPGQSLQITSTGPLVETGGGTIVGGTLTGNASSVSLAVRSNTMTGVSGFTVSSGDFLLVNNAPLQVFSPGTQAGDVGLTMQTGRTVTLVTDSLSINNDSGTSTGSGRGFGISVSGGTLVVAPFTANGGVLLTSGAKPATGLSLTTSELALVDASTLQIGGTGTVPIAGAITVGQAGDATIDLGVPGFTRLTLNASGAVAQNAALGITTLAGTAASLTLTNVGNYITELNGFTTTAGDIALHTSSGLTVSAPVIANANLTLSTEAVISGRSDNTSLLLAANVSGAAVRFDTTDGNGGATGILQSAGTLTAGTLTGVADTLLLTLANQVTNLGDFRTTGNLTLSDLRSLIVTGAVTSSTGAVTLNAPGITQASTSSITASELDGSATADTVLDSRLNAVSSIGYFNQTGGSFTLVTSSPELDFGAGQVKSTAGSLTFVADGLGIVRQPAQGAGITASAGLITFAPFTPSRPIALVDPTVSVTGTNALTVSTSLTTAGSPYTVPLSGDTMVLGRAGDTGAISLNVTRAISPAFRALQVQTTGAVTEATGSVLTIPSLTGSAGSISLPNNNNIASLGLGTGGAPVGLAATSGALTVTTVANLSLYGTVSARTAATLSAAGLTVVGSLTAPTVTLVASGAVAESAGTSQISATTLSITAASAALPGTGNSIGALTSNVSGDLSLTDATGLGITGGSTVGGTLNLTVAGAVTGGPLTARALTGSATSVSLTTAGNQISSLGPFTSTGGFNLANATLLTVAGTVSDPTAITLNVSSNLTLAGSLSSPQGAVTLTSTRTITQSSGAITARTLSITAASAALPGAGNGIGALTSNVSGNLTLNDAIALGITGGSTVGGTLNLTVAGAVTGGPLTAQAFTGSATSVALTAAGNQIASLGPFTSTGGFSLADAAPLTVAGTVSDPTAISLNVSGNLTLAGSLASPQGAVTLNSSGAITQPGGAITAATLSITAASAALPGTGTGNSIGALTSSVSGNLTLTDAIALGISGGSTVGGTLNLTVAGAVTGGPVIAQTLTGSATSVALNADNQIASLGPFTSTGGFSLDDSLPLTVTGPVSDPTAISLNASGNLTLAGSLSSPQGAVTLTSFGATTQSGGAITAATLTTSATGSVSLGQVGNSIGALTSTVSGNLTLTDATALNISGASTVGGTLNLTVAGAVTGGPVTAQTLTGSATSVALTAGNQIASLGPFTSTGGFSLVDAAPLTVTGPVSDPTAISLNAGGNLVLAGLLSSPPGAVTLISSGAITQSGGTITAATVTTRATGSVLLSQAGNSIGTLTSAVSGNLTLTDAIALNISGGSTVGGTLNLTVVGAVTGGPVTAQALTGSATSVALTAAGNQIASLGPFTSTGGFSLADAAPLTVAGTVSDPTAISLNVGGNLTLAGSLSSAPGAVTLNSSGAITQSGGSITAATLSITGASVALPGTGNSIGTLTSAVSGNLALTDAISLNISGGSTVGGTLNLTVAGAVTGGPVTAQALTGSATSVALTAAGNQITSLGSFTSAGGFSLVDATSLTVAGTVSAPTAIALNVSGNLALSGALSSPQGAVTLVSSGTITQPGGAITARTLTGSAAAASLTAAGNQIASLGPFTSATGFSLADATSLTVAGPVSAPTAISLNVSGDLAIAGALSSPQGTVTLNSSGTITQTGGAITAGTLTGSATGSATLGQAGNSIATLAGFTTGGDLTLVDGRSLVVSAPVDPNTIRLTINGDLTLNSSVTGGTVVLNVTGAIVEGPGGRIVADNLTNSSGSATLSGSNQIGTLGASATSAGFSFTNAGALTIAGSVSDGTFISLFTSGPITLAGDVSAPTISFSATGGGITQTAGSLTAAGTLTISSSGALTQSGGSFVAGTLSGSADSIDVGRAGLATIGQIAGLVATGQSPGTLSLVDAGPLRISGALSGRLVSITATGSLVLADGTVIRTDGSGFAVRSGPGGTATLTQTGTVTVAPLTLLFATLRIDLPAAGGAIALSNLQAGAANLVFNLGSGTAIGTLVARNLTVFGVGGRAALSGTVGGLSGNAAAEMAQLLPGFDLRYTVNGCAISPAGCSIIGSADVPSIFQPSAIIASAIASVIRPDILALDVLDLSVTRDRDDPTLLLPNISDKDY